MPARGSRPLALVAAAPAVARAARRAPRRGLQGPARDHIKAAPPPRCGPGRMEGCRRAVRGCRNGRPGGPRRSIRGDPPSANPAVAAGFSGMAAVGLVDYAAARLGCDAEECIQKALGDGEIGMCGRAGGGGGGYDVYRLTARAREANEYLRYVFRESAGGGGGVRVRGGGERDGLTSGPPFRGGPRRQRRRRRLRRRAAAPPDTHLRRTGRSQGAEVGRRALQG